MLRKDLILYLRAAFAGPLICTKTGFPICRIKCFGRRIFDGFAGQRLNRYLAYFGPEKWQAGYFQQKRGSMRFQDWQHDEAYLLLHHHHRHPHHNEYDNHQHFHLHQVYDEIWVSGWFGVTQLANYNLHWSQPTLSFVLYFNWNFRFMTPDLFLNCQISEARKCGISKSTSPKIARTSHMVKSK